MKAGTQNHVKVKRLKKLLGIPLYRAVGILETLWLLCQDCCDDGNLGKFTDEEIAEYLEWDGDIRALLTALEESRWVDLVDGRPVVHDWLEHCPEFIRERIRKREARAVKASKANVLSTYDADRADANGQVRTSAGPAAVCPVYSHPIPSHPNPTNQPTKGRRTEPDGLAGGLAGSSISISWEQVGSRLAALPLSRWRESLEQARGCGCTPELAMQVMDYAAEKGYGPGAVAFRIQRANPSLPISEGWPLLSPVEDPAEKAARDRDARVLAARRVSEAENIIKRCRERQMLDGEIIAELKAKGLEWPK